MLKKLFSSFTVLSVLVALAGASAPREAAAMKCQDTSSQCGLITGGGGGGGGSGGGGGGGGGYYGQMTCGECNSRGWKVCCVEIGPVQQCDPYKC